jgi:hypothetical protein
MEHFVLERRSGECRSSTRPNPSHSGSDDQIYSKTVDFRKVGNPPMANEPDEAFRRGEMLALLATVSIHQHDDGGEEARPGVAFEIWIDWSPDQLHR